MKKIFVAVLVATLLVSILAPTFAMALEPQGSNSLIDMMPAIALVVSGALALVGVAIGYVLRQRRMEG